MSELTRERIKREINYRFPRDHHTAAWEQDQALEETAIEIEALYAPELTALREGAARITSDQLAERDRLIAAQVEALDAVARASTGDAATRPTREDITFELRQALEDFPAIAEPYLTIAANRIDARYDPLRAQLAAAERLIAAKDAAARLIDRALAAIRSQISVGPMKPGSVAEQSVFSVIDSALALTPEPLRARAEAERQALQWIANRAEDQSPLGPEHQLLEIRDHARTALAAIEAAR